MAVTDAPIEIWRNTNDPSALWRFLEGPPPDAPASDLPEVFELDVYWPAQSAAMQYTSAGLNPAITLDRDAGDCRWRYTIEDSFRLPLGSKATYELFGITDGRRYPWATGTITVGTRRQ